MLNDPTGNRRNLIFEVNGRFNYDLYNSIDKEQLFAQLMDLHSKGFKAELNDAMIDLIEKYTGDKHSEASIEAETIYMLFEPASISSEYDFYTATQIKVIIEKIPISGYQLKS